MEEILNKILGEVLYIKEDVGAIKERQNRMEQTQQKMLQEQQVMKQDIVEIKEEQQIMKQEQQIMNQDIVTIKREQEDTSIVCQELLNAITNIQIYQRRLYRKLNLPYMVEEESAPYIRINQKWRKK